MSEPDNNFSTTALNREQVISNVCSIARYSPWHSQMAIGPFMSMLDTPTLLDQIKLYFNPYGECLGYIVWARLTPDVEKRYLAGADLSLHWMEWNEGTSLWIIDFSCKAGSVKHILEDMRDNLFESDETITYFRLRNGKRIFKRISRSDGGHFFKK